MPPVTPGNAARTDEPSFRFEEGGLYEGRRGLSEIRWDEQKETELEGAALKRKSATVSGATEKAQKKKEGRKGNEDLENAHGLAPMRDAEQEVQSTCQTGEIKVILKEGVPETKSRRGKIGNEGRDLINRLTLVRERDGNTRIDKGKRKFL